MPTLHTMCAFLAVCLRDFVLPSKGHCPSVCDEQLAADNRRNLLMLAVLVRWRGVTVWRYVVFTKRIPSSARATLGLNTSLLNVQGEWTTTTISKRTYLGNRHGHNWTWVFRIFTCRCTLFGCWSLDTWRDSSHTETDQKTQNVLNSIQNLAQV